MPCRLAPLLLAVAALACVAPRGALATGSACMPGLAPCGAGCTPALCLSGGVCADPFGNPMPCFPPMPLMPWQGGWGRAPGGAAAGAAAYSGERWHAGRAAREGRLQLRLSGAHEADIN